MGGRTRCLVGASAIGLAAFAMTTGTDVVSAQTGRQLSAQVTPATGLIDGQTVTVDVVDSVPNGQERVVQCVRGAANNLQGSLDESKCDASTTLPVDADGTGAFTTPYKVSATVTVGGTTVNCVVVDACEIVMAYATNSGPPVFGMPIEFAGATPAPVPDDVGPQCAQPYSPVGWRITGSTGAVQTEGGYIASISGVETRAEFPVDVPTVPSPPSLNFAFSVISIPGRGTYSIFTSGAVGNDLVVWLVSDSESLPFAASPPGPPLGGGGVRAIDTGGAVFLELQYAGRSGGALYRWRFDDPCGGVPTTTFATAVAGSPAFTG